MDLIQVLHKVLEENKNIKNKFIIIDTLGNHANYSDRYPKESKFDYFKDFHVNRKIKLDSEIINTINHYDNATRSWDIFMEEIFNISNSYNARGVLYFSDHGDEVYESIIFVGHSSSRATVSQVEIPFFIYTKDKNLKKSSINNKDKLWNTENFIHFIHSYLNLKSNMYESKKDILSKNYQDKNEMLTIDNNFNYIKSTNENDSKLIKIESKNLK